MTDRPITITAALQNHASPREAVASRVAPEDLSKIKKGPRSGAPKSLMTC
jgi:hypothetical protein